MTSFEPRIVLRPRTLDETFDLALAYLRASAREFWKISAVLVLVLGGLILAASIAFQLSAWHQLLLVILVAPVFERAITFYAGRHLFKNRVQVRTAFSTVFKNFVSQALLSVIAGAPWIGMLATSLDDPTWIALGTGLASFWYLLLATRPHLAEVLLLEQLPLGRASARSRVLTMYRFGRSLGLLFTLMFVRALFMLFFYAATGFLLEAVLQFGGLVDYLGFWPALIGYLAAGPYLALVRVFDYVDARTRREGWDIQVRFSAIAQRAKEDAARRFAA